MDANNKYFLGVICKNGHCISSYGKNSTDKFCEKCGAEVITACPHCSESIRGKLDFDGSYLYDYKVPAFCWNCGSSYPWTQAAIDAATEVIREEDEFNADQGAKLVSSLPDIITETPQTQVAIIRFRKALLAAGSFTADALRQFAIDFGCEFAKKQLGL